jgi:hypothetical protein
MTTVEIDLELSRESALLTEPQGYKQLAPKGVIFGEPPLYVM